MIWSKVDGGSFLEKVGDLFKLIGLYNWFDSNRL